MTVDSGGALRAVGVGVASVTADVGDSRSSRTVQVVPDLFGRWAGQIRYLSCSRESGVGRDLCRTGLAGPVSLTLSQTHDEITGSARAFLNESTGPAFGATDHTGAVTLSLTLSGEGEVDRVSNWVGKVTEDRMEAKFVIRREFTNIYGPQVLILHSELVDVQRR
jgi:hypothetical protein